MLLWLLAAALAASVPASEDVIRVGMDTRSRPWAFVPGLDYADEDFDEAPNLSEAQLAKLTGVDIEVLDALARQLGVATKVVPVAWSAIEGGLVEGRYDVIMNAWLPSSKTPPGIVASSPYYTWGLVVVVNASDGGIRSFADLAGKTVGHFEDPSVNRSARSLGAARLVAFEDSDQLFDALASRKLDAAVEDSTYSRWRAAHDPAFRIVGEPLNRLGYSLGVRAKDAALRVRLEAALERLRASGDLERIRERWESARSPGPR